MCPEVQHQGGCLDKIKIDNICTGFWALVRYSEFATNSPNRPASRTLWSFWEWTPVLLLVQQMIYVDQGCQGARVQDAVQRACVKGDAASGAPVTLGAGA